MKGFDDKALLLFPKEENWTNKPYEYKYQFRKAVNNICEYLKGIGIQPYAFYTDDVARDIAHPDIKWVSTLSRADRFFISRHCDMNEAMSDMVCYEDIYNAITAKDPGSLDMTEEERFDMVLRHDAVAAKKIIPKYKIVIHFMVKSKSKYTVSSKQGDGKIRVTINASNFIPEVKLSGNMEDPGDIFNLPYGNRCVADWDTMKGVTQNG